MKLLLTYPFNYKHLSYLITLKEEEQYSLMEGDKSKELDE